jgi:hypothetical protein
MDELKITSMFMKALISKFINKTLKHKTGCDISVRLDDLNVIYKDDKAHVHLSINADMDKSEINKLLKHIGFD